jgi:ribosomal-protein-alanine N-acetyltransferase
VTHRPDVVLSQSERLRVRPWRADAAVAQISPPPGRAPSHDALAACLEDLARRGYHAAITSALTATESFPFADAGFRPFQHLILLRRSLTPASPPAEARAQPTPPERGPTEARSPVHLRRARRRDAGATLALDRRAFDEFWHLDSLGLIEARTATTSSRWRVAVLGTTIVGYAVTGRTGSVAYLQRLAVDPDVQGRGVGAALVTDAVAWAGRHHCDHLLVNTQHDNATALALYGRLGFSRLPDGLTVWHLALEGPNE